MKRSVKKEKQKKNSDSRGTTERTSRGPKKGPAGPGRQNPVRKPRPTFRGETVDPKRKTRNGAKKKPKPKKVVHI